MKPKNRTRLRFYVRPVLAVTFAFLGVYIARLGTFEIDGASKLIVLTIAGGAFALLGFNLPELLVLVGRAGITAIAMQIIRELPKEAVSMAQLPFTQRRQQDPEVEYERPILVDTSVLIDGRIAEIIKSGFLTGELLIMPSVIAELHALSDSGDNLKRAKGRRGLDLLQEVKGARDMKLVVLEEEPAGHEVDEKLVKLAQKLKASILTVDFNLNKVASLRGVKVLNINELANAVKTKVLPGEELEVEIKAFGKAKDQGVGYLEDGTMVVVEGGAKQKGKNMTVNVMKVLQTAAGRMIFSQEKR